MLTEELIEIVKTLKISKGSDRYELLIGLQPNGKEEQLLIMNPELDLINSLVPLFEEEHESDIDKECQILAIQTIWAGVLYESIDYMLSTNIHVLILNRLNGLVNLYFDIRYEDYDEDSSNYTEMLYMSKTIEMAMNFFLSFGRYPQAAKNIRCISISVDLFTKLLSSEKIPINKLKSSFIISYLVGKEEGRSNKSLLALYPELSTYLLLIFENTLNCEGGDEWDFGTFEIPSIIIAILCLSISDDNKALMIDLPLLPYIVLVLDLFISDSGPLEKIGGSALGGGQDIESAEAAIETLLQLSFYFDDDDELRSKYMTPELKIAEMMISILQLPSSKGISANAKKNAAILLKRLTPILISEPKEVVQHEKSASNKHIMLSYAWGANKSRVIDLQKSLMEKGFDIWRDEDGSSILGSMSGNTDERMAEAIEAAETIIVCVSPQYKESANCRMEAKYATARAKKGLLKLIFVMMFEDYHTHSENSVDGWLAFMVGDALWYPLWDVTHIDSTGNEIEKLLGKASLGNPNPPTSPKPSSSSPKKDQHEKSSSSSSSSSSSTNDNELLILRNENNELKKENSILKAYMLIVDDRRVKPSQLSQLREFIDEQGIDDHTALFNQSREILEELSKHLKPVYAKQFLNCLVV